ncbi:MAG: hypothetical protein ABI782_09625, partial [Anaerolineaceae bacterium]
LDTTIDSQANGLWIAALAQTALELHREDERLAAERSARTLGSRAETNSPGMALGLATLSATNPTPEWTEAAGRAFDAALSRPGARTAQDQAILAVAVSLLPDSPSAALRNRQRQRLLAELRTRFPGSDELAAAECAATVSPSPSPAPAADSRRDLR